MIVKKQKIKIWHKHQTWSDEKQAAGHIRSDVVSSAVDLGLATAIDKVRKIARIIGKSPLKNNILQSYKKSKNRENFHFHLIARQDGIV